MRPTLPAQMRDKDVFSLRRALPRMSWSPQNLYNLARRQTGDLTRQSDFDQSPATLFQQRWLSKKLIRAYHGDFINEKIFKRWYLPKALPDVRPRAGVAATAQSIGLAKWARKDKVASVEEKQLEEEREYRHEFRLNPTTSGTYEAKEGLLTQGHYPYSDSNNAFGPNRA